MAGPMNVEKVAVGDVVTSLVKGPMTTLHLMRWSAAIENWHRIHYDLPFATGHDGLQALLINGSWKQHVLCQLLKDWAGPGAWVAELKFQYRSADLVGETITATGTVKEKTVVDDVAIVTCSIAISNDRGETSTLGSGKVAIPISGDTAVTLPFGIDIRDSAEASTPEREPSEHVSADVLALIGNPGIRVFAPEPVDLSSLRRFVQAIDDDDPIYRDEVAAKSSGYAGVVAPPLYPLHAQRRPAGAPDPLAAALTDPDYDGAGDVLSKHGLPNIDFGLPRLLNGGNEVQLLEPARVGDLIASQSTIIDVFEKTGRSGVMVFVVVDTDYTADNRDAILMRSRQTHIYR